MKIIYTSDAAHFIIHTEGEDDFSVQRQTASNGRKVWAGSSNISSEMAQSIGALIDQHLKSMAKPNAQSIRPVNY